MSCMRTSSANCADQRSVISHALIRSAALNMSAVLSVLSTGTGARQLEHVLQLLTQIAIGLLPTQLGAQLIYQCTRTAQHAQKHITGARPPTLLAWLQPITDAPVLFNIPHHAHSICTQIAQLAL